MKKQQWPEVLTREQFINALEQYTEWLVDEEADLEDIDSMVAAQDWVDHMDSIQPCWPEDQRNRVPIFAAILAERAAQDEQWGGREHDKGHIGEHWFVFIQKQAHLAANADAMGRKDEYRSRMVKIAALAVAALEASDE